MNKHSHIDDALKKYWGYDDFRPMQREIIESVLAKRDTLALLPTGGGKSLTYQVPAMVSDGLCIVVTPLIALMKDQVDRLRSLAISAVAIHSGMSPRQIDIALDNCAYGDVKFLYIAPERISTEIFRYRVQRMNVSLLAVDEAHCISQWGYDFRPSYLRIAELREHIGDAPILALTASATDMVVRDIMSNLKFRDENIIRGSFSRPNLTYTVRTIEDKNELLLKVIEGVKGSGIVYVRTRDGAEQISKFLNDNGIESLFYHGGLPHTERSMRQDEWCNNQVRVMVATNAFGMGIDKPDVRFVIHYAMSDSLEAYYQEAGRAGRDGVRSYALLMVSPNDTSRIQKRFEMEFPPIETIKSIYEKICSTLQVGVGEGGFTSYMFNVYEFCSNERLFSGTVLSAIKLLQLNGYLTLTDEMVNPARIMFSVSRDDLYKIRVSRDDLDHFIRVILRHYEGLFSSFRPINELELAAWSGYTVDKVKDLLKKMWRMRIIRYVPSNQSPLIHLDEDRLPTSDIYISPKTYKHRQDLTQERFENMVSYATNQTECRSVILEKYFGVTDSSACGVCDICLENKRLSKLKQLSTSQIQDQNKEVDNEIEIALKDEDLGAREIVSKVKREHKLIVERIDAMLADGKIRQLDNGKITLI